MIIFGLTGGIASGKSNVSNTIRKNNIPVIDADEVARDVVVPGSIGYSKIIDTFGSDIISSDLTLNRSKLGSIVFSDAYAMHKLNTIMAPLIAEETANQFQEYQDYGYNICCHDAALIIEMNLVEKYRPLVVVHCSIQQQLERLMKRNSLSEEEAMNRIKSQSSTEEKLKFADYSIDTSGTIENSIKQTEIIINKIKAMQ